MLDWTPQPPYTAEQLLQVIRILRDPENGCPWDKVQTHASIRKNFLEETCEALEAIDADDAVLLREELGDVLMQVVFHAAMEEERGRFTFEDVCRNVCEKLVFRHPNIFASSAAENAGINGWDALKNKEKGRTTLADELATVPATLPALMRAQKLQKRAAGHGLGQQDAAAAQHRLEAAVQDIVNRTVDAFQKGDVYAAGKIEPLEQVVDGLVREVKTRHIARLQAGSCSIEYGFVLDDLLTNYERVCDHCSNVAVAQIEVAQDSFDTHAYLNELRHGNDTKESEEFHRRLDRYRERYLFPENQSAEDFDK